MTETWLAPHLDRMADMSRLFFRYIHDRIEAEGGLSPSQFLVLSVLATEAPVTVGDLALKLGITTAGATGLLDRLVRSGLAVRTRDERDRRVVWVGLSDAGAHQFATANQIRRAVVAELFAALTPNEVAQLVQLFEKVLSSLPDPDEQPPRSPDLITMKE